MQQDEKLKRLAHFRALFERIMPNQTMPKRVLACARWCLLQPSSVRVYLSDSATHPPSQRTVELLEKALKRRKL